MMDVKVSKDKSSRWVDREPSILDEIESKIVHKAEEGDREREKK